MLSLLLFGVFALGLTAFAEVNNKSHTGKHRGCFNEGELMDRAETFLHRKLHGPYHFVNTLAQKSKEATAPACPTLTLQQQSIEYKTRSTSPWWYRIDVDEGRYPQKISVAECLCAGCIINGVEDTTYNSVPVEQTIMVLRKTICPHNPQKYSFNVHYENVPVACTCVVPREGRLL